MLDNKTAHCEAAKGTEEHNFLYCTKADTAIGYDEPDGLIPFFICILDPLNQGKRTDLQDYQAAVDAKGGNYPMLQRMRDFPGVMARHSAFAQAYVDKVSAPIPFRALVAGTIDFLLALPFLQCNRGRQFRDTDGFDRPLWRALRDAPPPGSPVYPSPPVMVPWPAYVEAQFVEVFAPPPIQRPVRRNLAEELREVVDMIPDSDAESDGEGAEWGAEHWADWDDAVVPLIDLTLFPDTPMARDTYSVAADM